MERLAVECGRVGRTDDGRYIVWAQLAAPKVPVLFQVGEEMLTREEAENLVQLIAAGEVEIVA